jgi:protein TonB
MLAYAASRPRFGARQSSPNAMLFVICAHIVGVAVVMSTKMDMPRGLAIDPPTAITFIRDLKPPEPVVKPAEPTRQHETVIHTPPVFVPTPTPDRQIVDSTPVVPDFSEIGKLLGTPQLPVKADPVPPVPMRTGAQLVTPAADLKPPYPQSKLLTGEEAELTLRLGIDSSGRVVSVEPVGRADRVFLEAARRHLMGHWRYKPATEGGRAVATSTVITLRFQLDG